jgi:hypothetical protein
MKNHTLPEGRSITGGHNWKNRKDQHPEVLFKFNLCSRFNPWERVVSHIQPLDLQADNLEEMVGKPLSESRLCCFFLVNKMITNLHCGNNRSGNNMILYFLLHKIYVNEPKPNDRDLIKDELWQLRNRFDMSYLCN